MELKKGMRTRFSPSVLSRMPRKQVHLTKEQQLLMGIEQLALGREYILKQNRFSAGELVSFHDSLQKTDAESDAGPDWGLDRKYSNYRKIFKSFDIPVVIDFQLKVIQGFDNRPDVLRRLLAAYLRSVSWNYSEEALDLFIRNTPLGHDALFLLVVLHYSVLHGLRTEFVYRKFFSMLDTNRRVVPLSILVTRGQFFLVALEPSTGRTKQFLLSRIVKLTGDFVGSFNGRSLSTGPKVEFNPTRYLQSSEADFSKPKRKYLLAMYGNTYDHFRHSFNVEHRVIEGNPKKCRVEIETADENVVFAIAFRYGEWCRIVEPQEVVERFRFKVRAVGSAYDKPI